MFVTSVVGVYFFFLVHGIAQERVVATRHGPENLAFSNTTTMIAISALINSLLALCAMWMEGGKKASSVESSSANTPKEKSKDGSSWTSAPTWIRYIPIALAQCAATFSSNASLRYVSYPTQVLSKSCKSIPVIIGSAIIGRQRHPLRKWISVLLISAGMILFSLFKESHSKKASSPTSEHDILLEWFGIGLLLVSLIGDGLTSGMQDSLREERNIPSSEMMLYTNFFGFLVLFLISIVSNDLVDALAFMKLYPASISDVLMFGITSAAGQYFVFKIIREFGALALSIVTTTRKFFTILLSVFVFGHMLATMQWIGVVTVFLGLSVDPILKALEKKPVSKKEVSAKKVEEVPKKAKKA